MRDDTIEIVRTAHGELRVFKNDTGVSEIIRRTGQYSFGEVGVYSQLLRDGGTFLDVGANIGALSFYMAHENPRLRIVCLEPQTAFFELCQANLREFGGVEVHRLAAGDRDGAVEFPEIDPTKCGNYGGLGVGCRSGENFMVEQVRLDTFLAEREIVPDLVKIDAEGMEWSILQGLENLLSTGPIVSLEADRPPAALKCLEFLRTLPGKTVYFTFVAFDNRLRVDAVNIVSPHILYFPGEIPDIVRRHGGIELTSGEQYLELRGQLREMPPQ